MMAIFQFKIIAQILKVINILKLLLKAQTTTYC